MKLFKNQKVKLEARFHWESTSCKALRSGEISKKIWKENNKLQKKMVVVFFFFCQHC